MFVIAQLVLGAVFCGNQSNCRNCRICRICILIGECWNGLDSLEILEHCRICRIAWKGWKVMSDWNVWNVIGRSCKTQGCISRISPCLLCVEFLFWNEGPLPSVCSSSIRRALCLLHVELDSGWRILWMYCSVIVHV